MISACKEYYLIDVVFDSISLFFHAIEWVGWLFLWKVKLVFLLANFGVKKPWYGCGRFASTIGRDIPFAGLMVTWLSESYSFSKVAVQGMPGFILFFVQSLQIVFYEGLAEAVKSGKDPTSAKEFAITGFEDMVIGGFAGGNWESFLLGLSHKSTCPCQMLLCKHIPRGSFVQTREESLITYVWCIQVSLLFSQLHWILSKQGCKCKDQQTGNLASAALDGR